jgi:TPR repeat protein
MPVWRCQWRMEQFKRPRIERWHRRVLDGAMQPNLMRRCSVAALSCLASVAHAQALERASPPCNAARQEQVRQGAERGDAASIYLLARYLSTGRCMPGDARRAIQLYGQAAELGYPPAFYNLGMLAAARQDFAAAERSLSRGAEGGHRLSELQLGILYATAPAPVGDDAKAFAWLSLTSGRQELLSAEASERLKALRAKLSDESRRAAEAFADTLKERYSAIPSVTPGP